MVPVRTCDDVLREVLTELSDVPCVLLKLDVQGHEREVLRVGGGGGGGGRTHA